jgi:hypothetical protein
LKISIVESPAMPGFFFGPGHGGPGRTNACGRADAPLPHASVLKQASPPFNGETARANVRARFQQLMAACLKGYPVSLSKKSCARLATYRQCADQHFEKTLTSAET